MAQSKPDSTAVTDMMNRVQDLMTSNPMMAPQITHMLEAQQRFLNQAHEYSEHWFARRQEAIETAMEATKGLFGNGASGPAAGMAVMSDWHC